MKNLIVNLFGICILLLAFPSEAQEMMKKKIVIAHRGASGYLPEHTLESKALAFGMGADYIEQDLALSRDNIPIVIHDIHLDRVTDVAEVYPDRAREDGRFYVIDFSFEELKKLKVRERTNKAGKVVYADRFPSGESRFGLHSLAEEIEMIQGLNKTTGKKVGIYPEIKDPGFHMENGRDISRIVLETLQKYGYKEKKDPCILQCFDAKELKRIRHEMGSELKLTQLLEYRSEITDLKPYAGYADAIGPSITLFLNGWNGSELQFNDLADRAHSLGLQVHVYTYRIEELYGFDSFERLLEKSVDELDVDGLFTDFPDLVAQFLRP